MNRFWSWMEKLLNRRKLKDKRSPKHRLDKKWKQRPQRRYKDFLKVLALDYW
jgi:hypothetical protein